MYYCFRCGKISKTKSNLNSHLRNKTKCELLFLDISRNIIINQYNDYIELFLSVCKKNSILFANNLPIQNRKSANNLPIQNRKSANNLPIISNNLPIQNIQNMDIKTPDIKNVDIKNIKPQKKCEYCAKKFSHRNSYYLHKKKYCKIIKNNKEKGEIIDEFLHTKYNLLKIEYEEKLDKTKDEFSEKLNKEIIEKKKIKENLENKIKSLELKLIPYNENNINNGHINNINNVNNNINNNITIINNYGEEKYDISLEDCEKIMSYEFDMIIKLIEYIHIIPAENRNAFIPSLKEKYAMILKNQKWDLVDRKDFIDNLIINKNIMLEKMLEEYGHNFENIKLARSTNIINYCKTDEEEYKKIKTNANLLLFNNKDMIRNTYEIKYNNKIQKN